MDVKPRISVVGVSFAIALALYAPGRTIAQNAAPLPAVTVAPVTEASIERNETFTGRVEAISSIGIRARVVGFVEEVGFVEGGSVAKGDILFRIESDAYTAAVTQARGQLESAEAEKTLADIEVDRQRTLVERETAAEAVLQRAEAEQGKVAGQLTQLQGSLQLAELDLSYTEIAAPFDGRVGFSEIDIGAFVGPDSGELVRLSSIDPIYVSFPVAEALLIDTRAERAANTEAKPLRVAIRLANGVDYGETGTIEVTDTIVQAGTDTVIVRARFPNPEGVLLEGQLVNVRVAEDAEKPSLVVPATALQRDQAGYFVYLVGEGKKAERRNITPGQLSGTSIVVTDGLSAGEQVIVEGVQRVRPGAKVDPNAAATSTGQ